MKNKSDQLFKDLGTDTTSAIRMFLTQAVAYNGFPFEIKRTVHNPYTSMTEEGCFKDWNNPENLQKRKLPKCGWCDFRYERKIWIIRLSLHQMQKKIWIDFFNIFSSAFVHGSWFSCLIPESSLCICMPEEIFQE